MARGNNLADKTAKEVAVKETAVSMLATVLPKPPNTNLPKCPVYMEEEIKWAKNQPMNQCSNSLRQTAKGKLILPTSLTSSKKSMRLT